MAIPKFLQPYLASYELSSLDRKKDKDVIITEILNKGDGKALSWLAKIYTQAELREVVSSPIKGLWMKSVLKYWQKILDINIPRDKFERAILDLNP